MGKFGIILAFYVAQSVLGKPSQTLKSVEEHYHQSSAVRMKVKKTVKLKLLEKERKYEGELLLKKGGKLRLDIDKPEKSLTLIDGKHVWMVSYPSDPEEKISVLKAVNPKKNQPDAVIAFLLGQGRIGDSFKVTKEKDQGADLIELTLKAKKKDEMIPKLFLVINNKTKTIETINFEDHVGNETELSFSQIEFDVKFENKQFTFEVPKNADVEVIK